MPLATMEQANHTKSRFWKEHAPRGVRHVLRQLSRRAVCGGAIVQNRRKDFVCFAVDKATNP